METINIPTSKKKSFFLVLLSIVMVAASYFVWIIAEEQDRSAPIIAQIASVAGMLLFTAAGLASIKNIIWPKLSITINETGILDETNITSVGLIKWEDILGFEEHKVHSTKLLAIKVKNPAVYLEQGGSRIKRQLLKSNQSMYGTPIVISTTILSISYQELCDLLLDYWKQYQAANEGEEQ